MSHGVGPFNARYCRNFHQNYERNGQKKAREEKKKKWKTRLTEGRVSYHATPSLEEKGRSENGVVLPVCSRLAIKNVDSKAKSTKAWWMMRRWRRWPRWLRPETEATLRRRRATHYQIFSLFLDRFTGVPSGRALREFSRVPRRFLAEAMRRAQLLRVVLLLPTNPIWWKSNETAKAKVEYTSGGIALSEYISYTSFSDVRSATRLLCLSFQKGSFTDKIYGKVCS